MYHEQPTVARCLLKPAVNGLSLRLLAQFPGSLYIARGWRHQYSPRHIRSLGLSMLEHWPCRHVVRSA